MSRSLSKRVRFEVFKRDSFTCQYCGRKAPDVILNCDHINPVAEGGEDDPLNLVTSCRDCNGGKGAIPLADSAMLDKQRAMLEELEERRQQIEMMIQWRDELQLHICGADLDDMERRAKAMRRSLEDFEGPYDAWLDRIGRPF